MLSQPLELLLFLTAVPAVLLWLEGRKWGIFSYFPPLLWSYAIPVGASNLGLIPQRHPFYQTLSGVLLPVIIVSMLVSVDLRALRNTASRAIVIMLAGSLGMVLGAALACWLLQAFLPQEIWKVFGALSGAWIGGTANMAVVAEGLSISPDDLNVALLSDNLMYIVWLPFLLAAKRYQARFAAWSRADPGAISLAESDVKQAHRPDNETSLLVFAASILAATLAAELLSHIIPPLATTLNQKTYRTLLLTTFGILLSLTRLRNVQVSRSLGLSLVYVFLGSMGAQASLSGLASAPWFLLGSGVMLVVHALFVVLVARWLGLGLTAAAVASAANMGGVATAPIVAAHHDPRWVPTGIVMALLGYTFGNYLGLVSAQLCYLVAG